MKKKRKRKLMLIDETKRCENEVILMTQHDECCSNNGVGFHKNDLVKAFVSVCCENQSLRVSASATRRKTDGMTSEADDKYSTDESEDKSPLDESEDESPMDESDDKSPLDESEDEYPLDESDEKPPLDEGSHFVSGGSSLVPSHLTPANISSEAPSS